ncbi:hypothetical protein [Phenylobacterium sp.]|uniref:hypothetical protein n=1 Tax=Phenylobacterium sp. TaxID=1871053 RepID=UPI002CDA14B4|nr:hypothetical protein [Phenylobacterium sp.]HLZ75453.1 hypothetical protein [Phenylobacterium sp.]
MAKALPEPPIRRYRGLTVAEWLTAGVGLGSVVIGIGSLAVAWLTYENGKDTRDIKRAIASLTTLAEQTKRQADNSAGQLAVLRDQVGETRRQTTAIEASATANAKSAEAQRKAADIDVSTTRAALTLSDPNIFLYSGEIDENATILVKIRPEFSNIGSTSIYLGAGEYHIFIGGGLPAVPPNTPTNRFGGANDLVSQPHSTFGPTDPIEFRITKAESNEIEAGRDNVYIYGFINFTDFLQKRGKYCFAYRVSFQKQHILTQSTGGPAYHCAGYAVH